MSQASTFFDDFRGKFPDRDPNLSGQQYADETEDFSANREVFSLPVAPCHEAVLGSAPIGPPPSGSNAYLWLITTSDVLAALETSALGRSTQRKRLAHTNLQGAKRAHCGGEMWFRNQDRIWLTGGSSRFRPRSSLELESAVKAFIASGYAVCSCGWDSAVNAPARFFRGVEEWK